MQEIKKCFGKLLNIFLLNTIQIATTKIAIQLINFDKIQVGRFIALTAKWHLGNLHLKVEITYIGEVP